MDKDIINQFIQDRNKNETVEILKELFDDKKLNLITDLENDEISLITRILGLTQIKKVPVYDDLIKVYTGLLLSRKRKSRLEIIDAIKGHQDNVKSRLGNMFSFNRGGRDRI